MIPLINRQALGNARIVPVRRRERRLSLGQMGPMIGEEEIKYKDAVKLLEGIKRAYENVVMLLGKDKADKALEQANKVLEAAQAEYARMIPQK